MELRNKVDIIRRLCPRSKLVLCPILPTKRMDWTNRARCFNGFVSSYVNQSNGNVLTMNPGEFCDKSGMLADCLGKYWKPDDPLHLGSSGIRLLASKIRHCVYASATSGRSYSSVLGGSTSGASRYGHTHHGGVEHGPAPS